MAPPTEILMHREAQNDSQGLPGVDCFLPNNEVADQLALLQPGDSSAENTIRPLPAHVAHSNSAATGLYHDDIHCSNPAFNGEVQEEYPGAIYTSLQVCSPATLDPGHSPGQIHYTKQLSHEMVPSGDQSQHGPMQQQTDNWLLEDHEDFGYLVGNGYQQDCITWSNPSDIPEQSHYRWPCHTGTVPEQRHFVGRLNKRQRRCLKLQHWLLYLLEKPEKYSDVIVWLDRSHGVFTFLDSKKVATYWGEKKGNNSSMTYEHMARAMRHYYKSGIMSRVRDRRLVYKFGENSDMWKRVKDGYPVVLQG